MYIVVMRSLFVNVAAVRQQLNNQLSRIRGRLGTPSQKAGRARTLWLIRLRRSSGCMHNFEQVLAGRPDTDFPADVIASKARLMNRVQYLFYVYVVAVFMSVVGVPYFFAYSQWIQAVVVSCRWSSTTFVFPSVLIPLLPISRDSLTHRTNARRWSSGSASCTYSACATLLAAGPASLSPTRAPRRIATTSARRGRRVRFPASSSSARRTCPPACAR